MTFESLWPLAFLLAIPIIIIFYLLVPKGKDTKVSSNLLWNKLFVNRQSKTFFRKIPAQYPYVYADRDRAAACFGAYDAVYQP